MKKNVKNSFRKHEVSGMLKKMTRISALALVIGCANVHAQNINTIAGTGTSGYSGDGGAAVSARLDLPTDVEASYTVNGEYYIVDQANHVVRKVSPSGVITTVAGNGSAGYSGDGGPATAASLSSPVAVDIDHAGNIYISDYDNNVVRKVSAAGIITTFAGTGSFGYSGDGGAATDAELNGMWGLETDAVGNVYISDVDNNVIRKVDHSTHVITTYAGNGSSGFSGDGSMATAAKLNQPTSISMDDNGNLYILDHQNNRVRKVSSSGVISTYAGNGLIGYTGDGGPATSARVRIAWGIDADDMGNVYISDEGNRRVRKINTSGIISTVAGNGSTGYTGDGGPATAARIGSTVEGLGLDENGNLLIADGTNHVIRKVDNATNYTPVFTGGTSQNMSVCTNWVNSAMNHLMKVSDRNIGQTLTWSVISAPSHGTAMATYSATSTGGVLSTTALYYTPVSGYVGSDAFTVQVSDGTDVATTVIHVTVNALPAVPTISGTSVICVGGTTTLSGSPSGGSWNSTPGTVLTTSAGGVVTGLHGGQGWVNYRVYNALGCWSQGTDTVSVQVPGAIPGFSASTMASPLCPGNSFTLTHPTTGGTWSSTNNTIATVSGGTVTAVASGRDTIYYTVINSCGSASARWPFAVAGAPNVAAITGYSTPLCPGGSASLADATMSGSWSTSAASVASVSASGSLSAIAAGTAVISYSVTNSCGLTGRATKTVTVAPAPNAGTITGPTTVINGATITLATSGTGGIWSSTNTAVATINSGGLVRGRSIGSDSIYYRVSNYCGTSVAGYALDVVASRGAEENGSGLAINEEGGIKLYPNPTSGIIHVEITGSTGDATLTVTDISGKVIIATTTQEKALEINMDSVPAGVYLVRVNTGGKVYSGKVVVE